MVTVGVSRSTIVRMNSTGHPFDSSKKRSTSRRRYSHFTDISSSSMLHHLLKGEGGAAEWHSRRRLSPPDMLVPGLASGGSPSYGSSTPTVARGALKLLTPKMGRGEEMGRGLLQFFPFPIATPITHMQGGRCSRSAASCTAARHAPCQWLLGIVCTDALPRYFRCGLQLSGTTYPPPTLSID